MLILDNLKVNQTRHGPAIAGCREAADAVLSLFSGRGREWSGLPITIYQIEEDEGRTHLKIGGVHIATVQADTPAEIALLKLDAEIRALHHQEPDSNAG